MHMRLMSGIMVKTLSEPLVLGLFELPTSSKSVRRNAVTVSNSESMFRTIP